MPKSRAEIQKAYRQRLKEKNNEEYLQKERDRMRRNYIPASALSENDRKKRNAKNREKLRRFYTRKRLARSPYQTIDTETSGYESEQPGTSEERGRLRVRLSFQNNRRKGAVKRWKRELSQAQARIRLLEQERNEWVKKCRTTQRSLQRYRQKKEAVELTPRKETERLMKAAKLTKSQKEKIRKPLLLGNVMAQEVRETKDQTSRGYMKAVHRVISGKIVKKYKCTKLLADKTGLCRHRLAHGDSKSHQIQPSTRRSTVYKYKREVEEFLMREDNSRMQPGKADAKRIGKGEKIQTYILSDYLFNLFQKFKSENPASKLSFASFCRTRPKNVLTAAFSSRSSCLCTKHQNAALTLKALRKAGVEIQSNPEKVIENMPNASMLKEKLGSSVVITQWKRKEVEEKGKKKYVTKIVESQLDQEQFLIHFEDQMKDFEAHVDRVRAQYNQIRILKQNLPKHEMIVQLDFAANYSCKSLEEVQSAYFNQTCVTLHPMVAYYREEDDSLQHKSFITVSDEMAHRSSTVITFINDIMPSLKSIDSELKKIHYWSDSPTSQYRNRYIFDFVANHNAKFGIEANWNYFEAGHGKGPCDGLGGTCKRLADEAMRTGKTVIQDAHAFYRWATQSNMKNVTFRFVSSEICAKTEIEKETRNMKSVKDTLKIHAVVGLGNSEIKVRDTSCYCNSCLLGQLCDSWRHVSIPSGKKGNTATEENTHFTNTTNVATPETFDTNDSRVATSVTEEQSVKIGDYVAAVYDKMWYVGEISDMDEDENEINFMQMKKKLLQWPRQADKIWLSKEAILCKIRKLKPTGKSMRMFQLEEEDAQQIIERFREYQIKF